MGQVVQAGADSRPAPFALALYQPDIPQNAGAMLRLCACLGLPLHVIEPCGFVWSERRMGRTSMDYAELAQLRRHASWSAFKESQVGRRLVLATTQGAERLDKFSFAAGDVLMMGRESSGVPEAVHAAVDARVLIPMAGGARSLNLVTAAALASGRALDQLKAWPHAPVS